MRPRSNIAWPGYSNQGIRRIRERKGYERDDSERNARSPTSEITRKGKSMATKKEEFVSLDTLAHGAAIEMFNKELDVVLDNILDPNTKAEAPREVTLKLKIKPAENRRSADATISVVSKLAPIQESRTLLFLGKEGGRAVAAESDMKQLNLTEASGPVPIRSNGS